MTKQLMTWARSVSGMGKRSGKAEFSSQAALQSYLRQHPGADASKHSVAQATPTSGEQRDAAYREHRAKVLKEQAVRKLAREERFGTPPTGQQLTEGEQRDADYRKWRQNMLDKQRAAKRERESTRR